MDHSHFTDEESWAAIGVKPDPDTWLPVLTLFVALQEDQIDYGECDDCGGGFKVASLNLTPSAAITAGLELIKSAQMVTQLQESLVDKTLEERQEIINLYAQFNRPLEDD